MLQHFADNKTLCGDLVGAQIVAVLSAARLNYRHHSPQLPLDLDITLQDDVVRQKGDNVRREAQLVIVLYDFYGHQNCDSNSSHRAEQPVEGFAEVLLKGRRERGLKSRNRIQHDTRGPDPVYRFLDRVKSLVHREIEWPNVDQL